MIRAVMSVDASRVFLRREKAFIGELEVAQAIVLLADLQAIVEQVRGIEKPLSKKPWWKIR